MKEPKTSREIWRYQLGPDENVLTMPVGARVLSVATKRGHPHLWVWVDPHEQQTENRVFRIFGTGEPICEAHELLFIGTFLIEDETLVFHCFEVKP